MRNNAIPFRQNNFNVYMEVRSKLVIDGGSDEATDISIMIPTFNRPRLLKEAVLSALSQKTQLHIEVVVVDNSTDIGIQQEIDRIIKGLLPAPIKLYRNEKNIGMFGNWNRCITLAKSSWLTILNDDDLLHPCFLQEMWNFKKENEIIYCQALTFKSKDLNKSNIPKNSYQLNANTKSIKKLNTTKENDILFKNPLYGTLGAIIPKNVALDLGGYNENLWPTSDYDFIVRAAFSGIKIKFNNKFLAYYRLEENESLKIVTLEGFLKNDYEMRINIINHLSISPIRRMLLKKLVRYQARIMAYSIYPSINNQFDAKKNLLKLSINEKKPFLTYYSLKIISILWLMLWIQIN